MSILPPIPGIHDLSEQELEIIAVLVSEPWSEDWEARCAGLGRLWFEHGRSRGALVELGLALAEVTGAARGDLVGALVVGYVEGRDAPGQTDTGANLARRSAELAALWRIIQAANSTDSRAAMQVIVDTVTEVMSVDVCSIFLFDTRRNRLILRATKGLSQGAVGVVTIDLGQGPAGLAAQEGQPVVVPDVGSDSRYHVEPRLNEPRSGSAVAVPIILFQQPSKLGRGDQLQGVISIQSLRLRTFTPAEVEFLETVAGDLAFFLANLQRYEQTDEQLQRTIRELETLQEVTAAITSTLDLPQVLRQIVQRAGELVSARAAIYEWYTDRDRLNLVASAGAAPDERLAPLIRTSLAAGYPIRIADLWAAESFPELANFADSEQQRSLICIPLRAADRILGAIVLSAREPGRFEYEEARLLSAFANEAAVAIENARLYTQAQSSLRTAKALLKELNHRVPNNLLVLRTVLQMEARQLEDGYPGKAALIDCIGRVDAIGAIHHLLQDRNLGVTSIQQVAQEVIDEVRLLSIVPVSYHVLGERPIAVASREASLLALILNELFQNALKHGLAAEGGTVEVEIMQQNGEVVVEVRDDGPRRPRGPEPRSTGVGHVVVTELLATLGGELTSERDSEWFHARLHFPAGLAGTSAPSV